MWAWQLPPSKEKSQKGTLHVAISDRSLPQYQFRGKDELITAPWEKKKKKAGRKSSLSGKSVTTASAALTGLLPIPFGSSAKSSPRDLHVSLLSNRCTHIREAAAKAPPLTSPLRGPCELSHLPHRAPRSFHCAPERQEKSDFLSVRQGRPRETSPLLPSCSRSCLPRNVSFSEGFSSSPISAIAPTGQRSSQPAACEGDTQMNRLRPCPAQDEHLPLLTSSSWPSTSCFQQRELVLRSVCCSFFRAQKRRENLGKSNQHRESPWRPGPAQQNAGSSLLSLVSWHVRRHLPVLSRLGWSLSFAARNLSRDFSIKLFEKFTFPSLLCRHVRMTWHAVQVNLALPTCTLTETNTHVRSQN